MNEVEQLETRVSRLSAEDLAHFRRWFRVFDAAHATALESGPTDKLVDESLADYGSGDVNDALSRPETLAGALRRAAGTPQRGTARGA